MLFNNYYGFATGLKAGAIFAFCWPIISGLSIYLADLLFDLTNSIRPLLISLSDVTSSTEPLREMRADLQIKIRALVEELGPEFYGSAKKFQDIRVISKEKITAEDRKDKVFY